MSTKVQLNKKILILSVITFFGNIMGYSAEINFKTTITKGTCEFSDNNDFNKIIDFNQKGLLVTTEVNKYAIKEPIESENISYTIICKDYSENTEKKVKIKSKTAASTQFNNDVFFGENDKTNTGFLLEACDSTYQKCNTVNDVDPAIFPTTTENNFIINYRVSFVKRENNVQPGISTASVIFEYYQD